MSIQELYDYSSRVRRRFAVKLSELPWSEVIKNREASFYSMGNILLHIIDNEDWMVNWGYLQQIPGIQAGEKVGGLSKYGRSF